MLCVLAFHKGDKEAARTLLQWIVELGGVSKHELALVPAMGLAVMDLVEIVEKSFTKVHIIEMYEDAQGWPQGPNKMWEIAARTIANPHPKALPKPQPWLWLEPDAVPLVPEWMDKIEAEYTEKKMPFMGDIVEDDPQHNVEKHMSGIGVYPPQVDCYTARMLALGPEAWDTFFRGEFLPYTAETKLIQHLFWQSHNPTVAPTFPDQSSLSLLQKDAVIFHRVKDSSLIDRLREKRNPKERTWLDEMPDQEFRKIYMRAANKGKIFTYFSSVEEINQDDAKELIYKWKGHWFGKDWEPVVLTESDAEKHPLYAAAQIIWNSFPCQNPRGYERACFNRWLAMEMVGGGFMSDYDVFPLNPTFAQPDCLTFYSGNKLDPLIPCFVYGDASDYEGVVKFLLSQKPTGTHFSDMIALRTFNRGKAFSRDVLEWGEQDWQKAKAVHFATARMQPAGKLPKWKHVEELMDSAKPRFIEEIPQKTITPTSIDLRVSAAEAKLSEMENSPRYQLQSEFLTRYNALETRVAGLEETVRLLAHKEDQKPVEAKKSPNGVWTPERREKAKATLAKARAAKLVKK